MLDTICGISKHKIRLGCSFQPRRMCELWSVDYLLAVNLLHACDEVENLVRVTDLIVVPADNLNESWGELDTCLSVEDRGAGIAEEVA